VRISNRILPPEVRKIQIGLHAVFSVALFVMLTQIMAYVYMYIIWKDDYYVTPIASEFEIYTWQFLLYMLSTKLTCSQWRRVRVEKLTCSQWRRVRVEKLTCCQWRRVRVEKLTCSQWRRVRVEKLTCCQWRRVHVAKLILLSLSRFSAFYGTRRFITTFTWYHY
jgi:hypothetical protein